MGSKRQQTTCAEPWREHMIEDVLPSLNLIGRNLAGVILRPNNPRRPTPEEKAINQAAVELLDLGQRFLSSCLTTQEDGGEVPAWLDNMTEQELMDALAAKSGRKIINGMGCEVPNSHHRDSGSGANNSR